VHSVRLGISSQVPNRLSVKACERVRFFAAQATLAVETARLHADLREALLAAAPTEVLVSGMQLLDRCLQLLLDRD
jgi:hypothetical protein